ncbi:MAG: hypothetical protein WKH64_14155 [Chloroflexia bacterium]
MPRAPRSQPAQHGGDSGRPLARLPERRATSNGSTSHSAEDRAKAHRGAVLKLHIRFSARRRTESPSGVVVEPTARALPALDEERAAFLQRLGEDRAVLELRSLPPCSIAGRTPRRRRPASARGRRRGIVQLTRQLARRSRARQ